MKNPDTNQNERLLEALIYGPLMVYTAMGKTPPKWLQLGMLAVGVGTVLYNAGVFVDTAKKNQDTHT